MTAIAAQAGVHWDTAERQDILLFGPPGHGKTTLRRALAALLNGSTASSRTAGEMAAEATELGLGGRTLVLWDFARADWWREVQGAPAFAGAVLVIAPTAGIGPEAGEEIEAQLALLRERGVVPLIVFFSHCDQPAEPALLRRAERAIHDLVEQEDPAHEVPLLRGAAHAALAGEEPWREGLRLLVQQMEQTFRPR